MGKDLAMHYVCTHLEALELIKGQTEFSVSNCGCREGRGKCERSRMDVCLNFSKQGDPSGSDMHEIDAPAALAILEEARSKKLVTRPFRNDDRKKTDGICFCCDDCCGYFLNKDEECDKGKFIEMTDMNLCVHCGACVPICYFGARRIVDGCLEIDRNECYGCGLCMELCPADAIEMLKRT
jgi:Pyruvate/2-oxoacid:ferredoxin oxidoreductase delta subunit